MSSVLAEQDLLARPFLLGKYLVDSRPPVLAIGALVCDGGKSRELPFKQRNPLASSPCTSINRYSRNITEQARRLI